MKTLFRILIIGLLPLFSFGQELTNHTVDSLWWNASENQFWIDYTDTYDNGAVDQYYGPVGGFDADADTASTFNTLKNVVYDRALIRQRGLKNVLDARFYQFEGIYDSLLFNIDSLTYFDWTKQQYSGRYYGIWKESISDPDQFFEFKEGSTPNSIRIVEVEDPDDDGNYTNVSGGLTGNMQIEANNTFLIRSLFTDNYVCTRFRVQANGNPVYLGVNLVDGKKSILKRFTRIQKAE